MKSSLCVACDVRIRPISRYLRQRFGVALLLAVGVVFSTGCASLVTPNFETETIKLRSGNYVLDPDHTFVLFRIGHLRLSKVIGRFNESEASMDFDPDDIESLRFDGQIKTGSIDIGNPEFEDQLRGSRWLNSQAFPNATFVTDAVIPGEGSEFIIMGQFTLRGVTQPLQLQARFNGGADNILTGKYTIGFSATGEFSRKSFGIDGFSALVGDTVEIEIEAEFQQQ